MIVHNIDKIHMQNAEGKRPDEREYILYDSSCIQLKTQIQMILRREQGMQTPK